MFVCYLKLYNSTYFFQVYKTNYLFDYKRGEGDYWQAYHDFGRKKFLGKGGYLNGDDIIDIILKQEVVAYFICEKIYKWFVY